MKSPINLSQFLQKCDEDWKPLPIEKMNARASEIANQSPIQARKIRAATNYLGNIKPGFTGLSGLAAKNLYDKWFDTKRELEDARNNRNDNELERIKGRQAGMGMVSKLDLLGQKPVRRDERQKQADYNVAEKMYKRTERNQRRHDQLQKDREEFEKAFQLNVKKATQRPEKNAVTIQKKKQDDINKLEGELDRSDTNFTFAEHILKTLMNPSKELANKIYINTAIRHLQEMPGRDVTSLEQIGPILSDLSDSDQFSGLFGKGFEEVGEEIGVDPNYLRAVMKYGSEIEDGVAEEEFGVVYGSDEYDAALNFVYDAMERAGDMYRTQNAENAAMRRRYYEEHDDNKARDTMEGFDNWIRENLTELADTIRNRLEERRAWYVAPDWYENQFGRKFKTDIENSEWEEGEEELVLNQGLQSQPGLLRMLTGNSIDGDFWDEMGYGDLWYDDEDGHLFLPKVLGMSDFKGFRSSHLQDMLIESLENGTGFYTGYGSGKRQEAQKELAKRQAAALAKGQPMPASPPWMKGMWDAEWDEENMEEEEYHSYMDDLHQSMNEINWDPNEQNAYIPFHMRSLKQHITNPELIDLGKDPPEMMQDLIKDRAEEIIKQNPQDFSDIFDNEEEEEEIGDWEERLFNIIQNKVLPDPLANGIEISPGQAPADMMKYLLGMVSSLSKEGSLRDHQRQSPNDDGQLYLDMVRKLVPDPKMRGELMAWAEKRGQREGLNKLLTETAEDGNTSENEYILRALMLLHGAGDASGIPMSALRNTGLLDRIRSSDDDDDNEILERLPNIKSTNWNTKLALAPIFKRMLETRFGSMNK